MLIITLDSEGNRPDKRAPEKCGDCHHCGALPVWLPGLHNLCGNGWYASFRCQHPNGCDWQGRPTGIDPNAAPPEDFCPMLRGIQKNKSIIYPKVNPK